MDTAARHARDEVTLDTYRETVEGAPDLTVAD